MTDPTAIRIKRLFRSPGHNFFGHHGRAPSAHPVVECTELKCLAGRGIEGDRFCDYKANYKGQITFFSQEIFEQLCAQLNIRDKSPGAFRRNVVVEGADLNALVGQEFELQGVRFLGTQECAPCHWMETAFGAGAEAALQGQGGLRAKILTDGVLRRPS